MFDNFLPIIVAESLPFYPLVLKLVVCAYFCIYFAYCAYILHIFCIYFAYILHICFAYCALFFTCILQKIYAQTLHMQRVVREDSSWRPMASSSVTLPTGLRHPSILHIFYTYFAYTLYVYCIFFACCAYFCIFFAYFLDMFWKFLTCLSPNKSCLVIGGHAHCKCSQCLQ